MNKKLQKEAIIALVCCCILYGLLCYYVFGDSKTQCDKLNGILGFDILSLGLGYECEIHVDDTVVSPTPDYLLPNTMRILKKSIEQTKNKDGSYTVEIKGHTDDFLFPMDLHAVYTKVFTADKFFNQWFEGCTSESFAKQSYDTFYLEKSVAIKDYKDLVDIAYKQIPCLNDAEVYVKNDHDTYTMGRTLPDLKNKADNDRRVLRNIKLRACHKDYNLRECIVIVFHNVVIDRDDLTECEKKCIEKGKYFYGNLLGGDDKDYLNRCKCEQHHGLRDAEEQIEETKKKSELKSTAPKDICLDNFLGAKYQNGKCEFPVYERMNGRAGLEKKFDSCQINKIIAGKGNTATAHAVCRGIPAIIHVKRYYQKGR